MGAGLGGLAASIALTKAGFSVQVMERAEAFGEVGAGIQVSPNAMWALAALGLDAQVLAAGDEPRAAAMRDWRGGRLFSLPLKGACQRRYGAPYVNIHRADLHGVLLDAASAAGVQIRTGVAVTGYRLTGAGAEVLSGEGAAQADLIIGADGLRSALRAQMLGAAKPRFTGNVAWRAMVPAGAAQVAPDSTVWTGPGRHLVTYPLRKGALINVVAVEERDALAEESWTAHGDPDAMRAAFANWAPEVTDLLSHVTCANLWGLFDRRTPDRWSDGAVALLGDACHPMPPFMAQGAAMALEDAVILARSLCAQPDIPTALKTYGAQRKDRTAKIHRRALANGRMFHGTSATGRVKQRIAGWLPGPARYWPLDNVYGHRVGSVS